MSSDTLTATAQRLARATGRVDNKMRDLKTARVADRIVPVFELMARRGQIDQAERNAGDTFARYWYGARRTVGLIGSYGDQRWSGTSIGQADTADLTAEEWPVQCAQRLEQSKQAIGDSRMAAMLERIVEADATLEAIGRDVMGYQSAKQATAAGSTALKLTLGRLAAFYGYTQARVPR